MLIKLNDVEHITVTCNHSNSNNYTINRIGDKLFIGEFDSLEIECPEDCKYKRGRFCVSPMPCVRVSQDMYTQKKETNNDGTM